MSRSERLFQLLQILRRHRRPVQAQTLAQELNIHIRTLYRDISALKSQGAQISGEPGLGYVLRPDFTLPPLMFTCEEISALVLGSRWVTTRTDTTLRRAAQDALAKIAAVIPANLRTQLDTTPLLIGPSKTAPDHMDLSFLRQSIHDEFKIIIHYMNAKEEKSIRTVWPMALGYFEQACILIAWCELRQNFRHFRCDRINHVVCTQQHYPNRRNTLLAQWKKVQNIN